MVPKMLEALRPPVAPHSLLVGKVPDSASLLALARKLRGMGLRRFDAHSSIPIHGMDEAMGLRPSPITWLVLGATVVGSLGFISFILWAALDYPMVHSGKGPVAFWAYIPAWAEVTWMVAGTAILVIGLFLMGLPLFHHPIFSSSIYLNASSDGFSLSVDPSDPKFDRGAVEKAFIEHGVAASEWVGERAGEKS